ncbi:MAG: hypothetical protein WBA57_25340 [Elainellaceae cyanobacterium]
MNNRWINCWIIKVELLAIAFISMGIGSCSANLPNGTSESDAIADVPEAQVFEPFRDAVNVAMEAAELTQVAATESDWRVVAQHWQTAIEMMKAVPEQHSQYAIAQQRATEAYPENFSYAQSKAGKKSLLLPSEDDERLTQIDFGAEHWPFVIDGELACEQAQTGSYTVKVVTLQGAGHTFALNGPAQARELEHGWQNIDMIWRDSPLGEGKMPIHWVTLRGEALCQA